jgi:hypothetical protein
MTDRKPRIGLLFTTQDRYKLACMALTSALEGIDSQQFDVTILWLDGSITAESAHFFTHFSPDRVRWIKESGHRGLGAARVIQLGMNRLLALGEFDWFGMLESDCYFLPDWLQAGMRAVTAARRDGVRVGAFSVESSRTPRYHKEYVKIEVVCASNALFLPEAWRLVPPASIAHNFPKEHFASLCHIPMLHPAAELGWDWIFAMALYHAGGFESVTTPQAKVLNCGTPDSHGQMFEQLYAQEDFETPVIPEPEPVRQRREAQWHASLRMCHAQSDAAILRCPTGQFSYLSLEFLPSWYGKEKNERSWWRWASGAADILVHNSSNGRLAAGLEFGTSSLDPAQVIRVSFNDTPLGQIGGDGKRFRGQIEIAPGINVLRFEPSLAGIVPPADGRRLAFALVSDWAQGQAGDS